MGADGGSIPDRRDLVKVKGKAEKTDRELERERFYLCALSKKSLSKPVVADALGKLYNKDAILEFLIDKSTYGDGEEICPYVKGVKDLLTLDVMPNPARTDDGTTASRAPFVCWLSLKEMTGAIPFIALRSCGCVFSETALRAVVPNLTRGIWSMTKGKDMNDSDGPTEPATCPNCGKPFDPTLPKSILPISPPSDIQDVLLDTLLADRAAAKANKKRKAENGDGKEKEKKKKGDKEGKDAKPKSNGERNGSDSPIPNRPGVAASSVGRSVHDMLAEQEKKRMAAQAGMSDAVRSMFKPKTETQEKGGAAEFFGRTFTRYA